MQADLRSATARVEQWVQVQTLPLRWREHHKLLAALQLNEEIAIQIEMRCERQASINMQDGMQLHQPGVVVFGGEIHRKVWRYRCSVSGL